MSRFLNRIGCATVAAFLACATYAVASFFVATIYDLYRHLTEGRIDSFHLDLRLLALFSLAAFIGYAIAAPALFLIYVPLSTLISQEKSGRLPHVLMAAIVSMIYAVLLLELFQIENGGAFVLNVRTDVGMQIFMASFLLAGSLTGVFYSNLLGRE